MPAMEPEQLAPFAVEVWRLGRRLAVADLSRERLNDSLRRLTAALEDAGKTPAGLALPLMLFGAALVATFAARSLTGRRHR